MTNCDELFKKAENGHHASMIKVVAKNEDSKKPSDDDDDIKIVVSQPKQARTKTTAKQISVLKSSSSIFNHPFASRGSMILHAALSDMKQDTSYTCHPNLLYFNRQPLHEKHSSLSTNANNNHTTPQKVPANTQLPSTSKTGSTPILIARKNLPYSSEKKRKSARKEVLFSDPIVTEKFIYEPTIVLDDPPSSSSSCSSNSDVGESTAPNSRMNVTIRNRNLYSPAKVNRTNHIRNLPQIYRKTNYSPVANTSVNCDRQPLISPSIKNARKRPYIDEISASPTLSDDRNLPVSDCSQLSPQVCAQLQNQPLFSPPKVAKIVPYYTDSSEKEQPIQITKDENCNDQQTPANGPRVRVKNMDQYMKTQSPRLDNSDEDMFEDATDEQMEFSHKQDKSYHITNCHASPFSSLCQSLWSAWKQVCPL